MVDSELDAADDLSRYDLIAAIEILQKQVSDGDRDVSLARKYIAVMQSRDGLSWRIHRGFSRIGATISGAVFLAVFSAAAYILFTEGMAGIDGALVFAGVVVSLAALIGFYAIGWAVSGFFKDTNLPPIT